MRILALCKRRPQGRDLFNRPYGRFYHVSQGLAARGREVHVLLGSYTKEEEQSQYEGNLRLYSVPLFPRGTARYIGKAQQIIKSCPSAWVIGFSDTWYGILAQRLAERSGSRSLVDAYDNYESYMPWFKPLHWLWRRSVARADLVTAAGPQLAHLLAGNRGEKPTWIMPMAADPGFYPRDRIDCRRYFGLPRDKKLIGYFGALYSNRGIDVLFEAFRRIRSECPGVDLVLSGRADRKLPLPEGARWFGYLSDEAVPLLVNAVDVAAVVNRRSAFGDYSYPAKLYEAMRCGIPVVASDTAAARWILKGREECLAQPEDSEDLKERLLAALDVGFLDYGPQVSWEEIVRDLDNFLLCFEGA
jgi:glycosyltransferase involved in cell wall biosynthesis